MKPKIDRTPYLDENHLYHMYEAARDANERNMAEKFKALNRIAELEAALFNSDTAYEFVIVQLQQQETIIAKLKACAEFYADSNNWTLNNQATKVANQESLCAATGIYNIIYDDSEPGGVSLGSITNSVGGKLARETLAEIAALELSKGAKETK